MPITDPLKIPIYHITHVDNLSKIIQSGGLWSDAKIMEKGGSITIGMHRIKQRRLEELKVDCHPGTMVGEYVPFYFCPRSIMLYMIDVRNEELEYKDGQRPIIHLVSTIEDAIDQGQPWAFSSRNAATYFTSFYNNLEDINKLSWSSIEATSWIKCKPKK